MPANHRLHAEEAAAAQLGMRGSVQAETETARALVARREPRFADKPAGLTSLASSEDAFPSK